MKGMDKIQKFLQKLSQKERTAIESIINQIIRRDITGIDVKKLRGEDHLFRVRKGNIRIIFSMKKDYAYIITIERRNDTTY